MTLLESIRDYFMACPYLHDGRLSVEYLGAEPSYSINAVPTNPIIEKYVDGGAKKQFTFVFQSYEEWGNDTLTALENYGFYEEMQKWIEDNNKKGVLPVLDNGKTPFKMELLTYGYLFSNTEDKATYQIQARLIYVEL